MDDVREPAETEMDPIEMDNLEHAYGIDQSEVVSGIYTYYFV